MRLAASLSLSSTRAASPDVAVFQHGTERVHRPLLALHAHDVGVRHEQDRTLRAVAPDARDQVRALRLERERLDRNAFRLEHLFQVVDRAGFVAGRAAGVDLDQRTVVAQDLGPLFSPVDHGGPA